MLAGAVAGALGTAVMTLLMKPGPVGRLPARWRPAEFVPRQVVDWAERGVGRPGALPERAEMGVALAAHLGYGATLGALYAGVRGDRKSPPAAAAGGLWGLLAWVAGYEGWMPAAGVRPATTEYPPARWPVPIMNHVAYGVATALLYQRLRRRAPR